MGFIDIDSLIAPLSTDGSYREVLTQLDNSLQRPTTHTISVSGDRQYIQIMGTGKYAHGSHCTLEAYIPVGTNFGGWKYTSSGQVASMNNPWTFQVSGDMNLYVDTTTNPYVTISVTAIHGTVVLTPSSGTVSRGGSVIAQFTPDAGYPYCVWSDGNVEMTRTFQNVQTDASYTVEGKTQADCYSLTFHWPVDDEQGWLYSYKATFQPDTAVWFPKGATVPVFWQAWSGYMLEGWYSDSSYTQPIKRGDNSLDVLMSSNREIWLHVVTDTRVYLGLHCVPSGSAVMSGQGYYAVNATATCEATAFAAGYTNCYWTLNGQSEILHKGKRYSFQITADTYLDCHPVEKLTKLTATIDSSTGEGEIRGTGFDSTEGVGYYFPDEEVSDLICIPDGDDYIFVRWSDGVLTADHPTIRMNDDVTLTAILAPAPVSYQVRVLSNSVHLSVKVNGRLVNTPYETSVGEGDSITVKVERPSSEHAYAFDYWEVTKAGGSAQHITTEEYTLTPDANYTIKLVEKALPQYTLTVANVPEQVISYFPTSPQTRYEGEWCAFGCNVQDGWSFKRWKITSTGGTTYDYDKDTSILMESNYTVEPEVGQDDVFVTIDHSELSSYGGDGYHTAGAQVTIWGIPSGSHRILTQWSVDMGGEVQTLQGDEVQFIINADADCIPTVINACIVTIDRNVAHLFRAEGDGDKAPNTSVTISGTADEHYYVKEWEVTMGGSTQTISGASITIMTPASGNVHCVPVIEGNGVTIAASASPVGSGTVTINGQTSPQQVAYGSNVSVLCTGVGGYRFSHWHLSGSSTVETTANPYSFTASEAKTLVAELTQSQVTITANPAIPNSGSCKLTNLVTQAFSYGSISVDMGTRVSMEVSPFSGYTFAAWDDGNQDNPRIVTAMATKTYEYTCLVESYLIQVFPKVGAASGTPYIDGVASDEKTVPPNTSHDVGYTPSYGYVFQSWSDGVLDNPRTYANVTSNISVTAFVAPRAIQPLMLTAVGDSVTISVSYVGTLPSTPDIRYSLDQGGTWTPLTSSVMLASGDSIWLRGNNPSGWSQSSSQYNTIVCSSATGSVIVSGKLSALWDDEGASTSVPNSYCYYRLFYNQPVSGISNLTFHSSLAANCYQDMFANCTKLVNATVSLTCGNLSANCYDGMFQGCTSLTTAPALTNAMTYNTGCYANMFKGCTSLVNAPAFNSAVTTPAQSCFASMYEGCTSLTQAPHIYLTSTADYCCAGMFTNCSSLNVIECDFTSMGSATQPFVAWVLNVAETGTFDGEYNCWVNPSTHEVIRGIDAVPTLWTFDTAQSILVQGVVEHLNAGTINGVPNYWSGYYRSGDRGSVTFALTDLDYVFDGWYQASHILTFENTYNFTASSDVIYEAQCHYDPPILTLNDSGPVSGQHYCTFQLTKSGSTETVNPPFERRYTRGDEVDVLVVPTTHYKFTEWSGGATANPRHVIMNEGHDLVAVIDIAEVEFMLVTGPVAGADAHAYYHGTLTPIDVTGTWLPIGTEVDMRVILTTCAVDHWEYNGTLIPGSEGVSDLTVTIQPDTNFRAAYSCVTKTPEP